MNVHAKCKQLHKYKRQIHGYPRGESWEEGQIKGMRLRDTNHYI